jgi:hypothetical protein
MQKCEYKTVTLDPSSSVQAKGKAVLEAALNLHAAEGWRLVQILELAGGLGRSREVRSCNGTRNLVHVSRSGRSGLSVPVSWPESRMGVERNSHLAPRLRQTVTACGTAAMYPNPEERRVPCAAA